MSDRLLLTRLEVEELANISRSSFYRMMRLGQFPEPKKSGLRSVCWFEHEVLSWTESRPRANGVIANDA